MGARSINGLAYDPHVPTFTLDANAVQQFNLEGAANHPFHLHIYHLQVQGDCGEYEDGEYYDVVSGDCTVKFDLSPETSTPFAGRTIMHCHILAHEDQGAMGWLDILGGAPAPGFPAGFGYDDYIEPGSVGDSTPAAPGDLAATAVSSNRIDLSWSDHSDNETLFNIERSDDGGNSFIFIDTAEADITSYSDTSVLANTTYFYRVRASNPSGDSPYSHPDSATTPPAPMATALALGSITVSSVKAGSGQQRGRAIVTVEDDTGSLVQGAIVTGQFSGSFTGPQTTIGPTAADGSVTFDSSQTINSWYPVTFEFCVTAISLDGLDPFTASPGAACSRFSDSGLRNRNRKNRRH